MIFAYKQRKKSHLFLNNIFLIKKTAHSLYQRRSILNVHASLLIIHNGHFPRSHIHFSKFPKRHKIPPRINFGSVSPGKFSLKPRRKGQNESLYGSRGRRPGAEITSFLAPVSSWSPFIPGTRFSFIFNKSFRGPGARFSHETTDRLAIV